MIKGLNEYNRYNFLKYGGNSATNNTMPSENEIYFHHLGKAITLPIDPESITDSMSASWAFSTPLSRSAPIYSYQNSGPRTVQFTLNNLHRDMVREFNMDWVSAFGETDVVDALINNLEACVLPDYNETGKIVNPPIVSVKLRDEIYIKGTVNNVSKSFHLPIIDYGKGNAHNFKYALVDISLQVNEVTPYSASILSGMGGYRNHA